MRAFDDRLVHRLTRHFFSRFFDLGFLSDAGSLSFTRLIIGICALFLSFGLLLTRVYVNKYGVLGAMPTAEPYLREVLADGAFLIATPMWIVAFVTVLVGHALFPDELDFRVLTALPITRRLIFGAKLCALALFTGLFIASVHLALAPLFALIALSRWAAHAFVIQAGAFGLASLLGSSFAVLAIGAMQGVLVLGARRGRLVVASAVMRSLMLGGLMLSLPLVGRLPASGRAFTSGSTWLYFAPPAWFVGLDQWLLGDTRPHISTLAMLALAALALAGGVAAGSYALLYRQFDRLLLRPAVSPSVEERDAHRGRAVECTRPVFTATRSFVLTTLRRSVLHQGIIAAISAVGLGLVANSFLGNGVGEWLARGGAVPRSALESIVWAPFPLMYVVSRAVRAALVVPIEPRANWVFRMTERPATRHDQLGTAVSTIGWLGVAAPVALLLPLQWLALGPSSLTLAGVAIVCGWLHVEVLTSDWDRIPFACSYIPGKGFVPQTLIFGAASFIIFTSIGSTLAQASAHGHPAAWVFTGLLALGALLLRRQRREVWGETPLQFEDVLPTEINPLRLSVD